MSGHQNWFVFALISAFAGIDASDADIIAATSAVAGFVLLGIKLTLLEAIDETSQIQYRDSGCV
jgi:hypothetical protein